MGLVNYTDELEAQFLAADNRRNLFIDDAEFRREWDGPGRVFAVARIRDAAGLFADPAFRYHVLAAGPRHWRDAGDNERAVEQLVRAAELAERGWAKDHAGDRHTVAVHIGRLRDKIERDPARPELIVTVWGVGYRFEGARQ